MWSPNGTAFAHLTPPTTILPLSRQLPTIGPHLSRSRPMSACASLNTEEERPSLNTNM